LRNLIVAKLVRERRHVSISIVDNFMELGVGLFLDVFRSKISCLQLFAQGRVSYTISPVAELALALENGCARASLSIGRWAKSQEDS